MQYTIATTVNDFEQAGKLFLEYSKWLQVDLCFQSFANELETLPTMYNTQSGGIVLCKKGDEYIGCAAIRRIDDTSCELKRMWVQLPYQKKGIGEMLLKECIQLAKNLNYKTIKLDTLQKLQPAISLYKKYGFAETKAYYNNPLNSVVYMELNF